jgi:hypothetical protein
VEGTAGKAGPSSDVFCEGLLTCIEVAPYKHGKPFSMDSRRLYCLKESRPADRVIWVKKILMPGRRRPAVHRELDQVLSSDEP